MTGLTSHSEFDYYLYPHARVGDGVRELLGRALVRLRAYVAGWAMSPVEPSSGTGSGDKEQL